MTPHFSIRASGYIMHCHLNPLADEPVLIGEALSNNLQPGVPDTIEVSGERDVKFDSARCSVYQTSP
jgi:hypothetical protein